jgi:hypothetical protein
LEDTTPPQKLKVSSRCARAPPSPLPRGRKSFLRDCRLLVIELAHHVHRPSKTWTRLRASSGHLASASSTIRELRAQSENNSFIILLHSTGLAEVMTFIRQRPRRGATDDIDQSLQGQTENQGCPMHRNPPRITLAIQRRTKNHTKIFREGIGRKSCRKWAGRRRTVAGVTHGASVFGGGASAGLQQAHHCGPPPSH